MIQTQLINQEWAVGNNLRAGSDPEISKFTVIQY